MRVLLIGSGAVSALADGLRRWGHEVSCLSQVPTVAAFCPNDADAVIVDLSAPTASLAGLQALLQKCSDAGTHCLLVAAETQDEARAGPFVIPVPGPVSAAVVQSLLAVVRTNIGLQHNRAQLGSQVRHLQNVVDGEHRLARRMLDQFINVEQLADPAIQYWTRPADVFGGDVLLAARTPANVLHIMMVDDMHCGTLAAVSALPVIAPFYRMTEKGFSIDAIVREANSRIFRFYPEGHPVATTLVSVDFNNGVIHAWNGGTPAPILFAQATGRLLMATPRAVLGSVRPAYFDVDTDVWTFEDDELLALGSGGLLRQLSPAASGAAMLEAFRDWLQDHGNLHHSIPDEVPCLADGLPPGDDMSLLLVSCRRSIAPVQERSYAEKDSVSNGEWKLSLVISPEEMRSVDIVPLLLGVVGQFEMPRAMGGTLFLILSELYNNALDHGVLGLDSSLKLSADGMGAYLDERARRLAGLEEGEIELSLRQELGPEGPALFIVCRDSGPGFDHAQVRCGSVVPEAEVLPYGRGLALVSSLASQMEFNPAGNQLCVQLLVASAAAPENRLS